MAQSTHFQLSPHDFLAASVGEDNILTNKAIWAVANL